MEHAGSVPGGHPVPSSRFGEVIGGERARCLYPVGVNRLYRIGNGGGSSSRSDVFACGFGTLFYLWRITLPELGGYDAAYTLSWLYISAAPAPVRWAKHLPHSRLGYPSGQHLAAVDFGVT